MNLGAYTTAGTIIYRARIYLWDKVASGLTNGKVWSETDLVELANDAQRELVGFLSATKYAEALGNLYREFSANVHSGDQDIKFTTLGIASEIVTGVKVRYKNEDPYLIAKPLTQEDPNSLDAFMKGTKTSPRYTLVSLTAGFPVTTEQYLRIIPAFDADVTKGIVAWQVAQPAEMSQTGPVEASIPSHLHFLIPKMMAYLGWGILGEDADSEKWYNKVAANLMARFKGLEEIVPTRAIRMREKA